MNKKQHGFGAVEAILIVIIILLIGALGWVFWNNSKDSDKTEEATTSETQQQEQAEEPAAEYTLDQAVTDINKTLATKSCGGAGGGEVNIDNVKTVSNDAKYRAADGGISYINEDLTYASVIFGCGSSGSTAYLKKSGDNWTLLSESATIYHKCEDVRGQGIPSSLINKCYSDDQELKTEKI